MKKKFSIVSEHRLGGTSEVYAQYQIGVNELMTEDILLDENVGLFFLAGNELLLNICKIADGEPYGDFVNYPESHDTVWLREYYRKYRVDFDYFPRGRIIFNKTKGVYLLYHDPCIAAEAEKLRGRYPDGKCEIKLDEHYQCHKCNSDYVI